jgi:aspartyl-tRNA(Asn)/glutamyl-tRNA(Gln) amidotransferase subunit C
MNIDKKTLHKIAHLSRLEIKPEDEEKMLKEMSAMVSFVEKLNEVDTTGVEPLTTMSHEINSMRGDGVNEHLDRASALKLAPSKDDQYFKVPKVLE